MLTPHEVHYGLPEKRVEERARVLAAAFAAHPERFVAGLPRPPALPTEVWISPRIGVRDRLGSIGGELLSAAVALLNTEELH